MIHVGVEVEKNGNIVTIQKLDKIKIEHMTKRIYFATSFKHRKEYENLYQKMISYFDKYGIEVYSFAFEYGGSTENKIMLKNALNEMDKSDLIIADGSYDSVGVGMEVGYFKGKNKKVIYLHKKDSFLDENMDGVSDYVVDYLTEDDVLNWLKDNIEVLSS
jgi:nucleoside 2-deoxyribosyltransferase